MVRAERNAVEKAFSNKSAATLQIRTRKLTRTHVVSADSTCPSTSAGRSGDTTSQSLHDEPQLIACTWIRSDKACPSIARDVLAILDLVCRKSHITA